MAGVVAGLDSKEVPSKERRNVSADVDGVAMR
jgi:hypothetical protein